METTELSPDSSTRRSGSSSSNRWSYSLLVLLLVTVICSAHATLRRPQFPRTIRDFGRTLSKNKSRSNLGYAYQWETRWYEQTLDHFSFQNTRFKQKFLFSDQHWAGAESKAPIFMYCGNEGNIEWFAENSGFVWDIAPKYGALVVFPEHRYYGDSMPFGSQEAAYRDAESLAYLNSEQALADFVTLITDLKRNLSAEGSPVVLFGGSYGGMLAAWMRLKYPHIAIGALSSSAPILQFEDVASPYTFADTVTNNFKSASEACYRTIKASWTEIYSLGARKEGLQKLSSEFHLCNALSNSDELAAWTSSAYDYVSMVDYPYPSDFLQDLPAYPIKEMCKAMDRFPEEEILPRISAAMNVYYNYTGKLQCFDIADDPHGLSGWEWQSCTEMVMPSSYSNTSIYPPYEWTYQDFADWCQSTYGVKPRSHWILEEFGGNDIKAVLKRFGSNIVFSNGLVDPWSGGGVLNNISSTIVALITTKGAHHIDLRPINPDLDPQWLTDQRNAELAYIEKWLREFHADRAEDSAQML